MIDCIIKMMFFFFSSVRGWKRKEEEGPGGCLLKAALLSPGNEEKAFPRRRGANIEMQLPKTTHPPHSIITPDRPPPTPDLSYHLKLYFKCWSQRREKYTHIHLPTSQISRWFVWKQKRRVHTYTHADTHEHTNKHYACIHTHTHTHTHSLSLIMTV